MQAKLLDLVSDQAVLKKTNGVVVRVPLEQLSAADHDYLTGLNRPAEPIQPKRSLTLVEITEPPASIPPKLDTTGGVYAHIIQETPAGLIGKQILVFGDEQKSWMIEAKYPQELADDLFAEIRKSLLSTRRHVSPGETSTYMSDVDFVLTAPTLKLNPGWTKTIVFTKDGFYSRKDPTDPFFQAMPSENLLQILPHQQKQFALQRLRPSPDIDIKHIFIDRAIKVAGLPGRELMALANDTFTQTPILLYCAVLFDEDSFITMHGWVGQDVIEDYTAEFRAITRSFRRKTYK